MPQKKHKPEEMVAKLRQVDVLVSQGHSVAEAVRSISVTQFTYYGWRKEFGGLKTDHSIGARQAQVRTGADVDNFFILFLKLWRHQLSVLKIPGRCA